MVRKSTLSYLKYMLDRNIKKYKSVTKGALVLGLRYCTAFRDFFINYKIKIHFPAAYDVITLSVDGRGSAFQGDRFTFANYRALGQNERIDQTEFVRWFINEALRFLKIFRIHEITVGPLSWIMQLNF